jgi:hypothetical protein
MATTSGLITVRAKEAKAFTPDLHLATHDSSQWPLTPITASKGNEVADRPSAKYRRKVPVRDLEKYVEPGDILLFQGRKLGACCIRCFTASQYDHVGIIVPNEFGCGIQVLEATGDRGVNTVPLSMFLNWNKWYDDHFFEICVRKVTLPFPRKSRRGKEMVTRYGSHLAGVGCRTRTGRRCGGREEGGRGAGGSSHRPVRVL